MTVWSVFTAPDTPPASREAAETSVFVKEGWCWPAFFFAPVWLLWRRMWLVFLGWLAVIAALEAAGAWLPVPDGLVGILELLFTVWLALEANGLRGWTLARKGWQLAGVAAGSGRAEAEQRYFSRADALQPPAPPRGAVPRAGSGGVLGLFPEPDGTRA